MIKDCVLLAVEDTLSEAVARAALSSLRMSASQTIGLKGNTYLKKKVSALNKTAKAFPVFLLTDLDKPTSCPPELISGWISEPIEEALIFRVAIVEIESWVMADRAAFAAMLGISPARVPREPDKVREPKEKIVTLAKSSRKRSVREDIVPTRGSTASRGPGYNARLGAFVGTEWDPLRASEASPSLKRALSALKRFRDG
ncbi:MAG: hypothetical protein HQ567_25805 [Candidatus Nealsonbacteria bacterium]|nr:hypothetical protein [Candidatus Nealsonbacteria bacterium]